MPNIGVGVKRVTADIQPQKKSFELLHCNAGAHSAAAVHEALSETEGRCLACYRSCYRRCYRSYWMRIITEGRDAVALL